MEPPAAHDIAPGSLGEIPEGVRRLFPHHDPQDLLDPRGRSFLVSRLLEDGDRRDLAWLVRGLGLEALRRWLEERGERQLSRRSCAFWRLLLSDTPPPVGEHPDDELWPL